ncbi:MAG: hypothetical protein PVJ02_00965 [Gemmatimonadota bacterium]
MTPIAGGGTQRGSVLVVAVLITLALELLAHGALLMAREELFAARTGLRLLRARAAAEAAVRTAPLQTVGRPYRTLPLWTPSLLTTRSLQGARSETRARRLSREVWLVEGRGRVGPGPWTSRDAGTVWLPDPAGRVADFRAVLEVGASAPVSVQGRVDAGGLRRDLPPLDPAPCDPWRATLDTLFAAGELPVLMRRALASEPSLGRLGPGELLAWLPSGPPSSDAYEARGASTLTLAGGRTRGLLVVSGDLVLDGAEHRGMALVGGRLVLRNAAVLVGMARAAGGVEVDAGSAVVGSGCRALLAVDGGLATWVRPLPLRTGGLGPW